MSKWGHPYKLQQMTSNMWTTNIYSNLVVNWCCIRVIISTYQYADTQTHKPYLGTRLKPIEEFAHCTQSELNSLTQFSIYLPRLLQNYCRPQACMATNTSISTLACLSHSSSTITQFQTTLCKQLLPLASLSSLCHVTTLSTSSQTYNYSYLLASLSLGTHTTHLQHSFIDQYIT